jgi:predicted 3-demethylubiquinone-9 3-methyltransferase (glyoxalase superfamily)
MSHEDEGHEFWPCSVVGTPRKRERENIDMPNVESIIQAMSSTIADLRSDVCVLQGAVMAHKTNAEQHEITRLQEMKLMQAEFKAMKARMDAMESFKPKKICTNIATSTSAACNTNEVNRLITRYDQNLAVPRHHDLWMNQQCIAQQLNMLLIQHNELRAAMNVIELWNALFIQKLRPSTTKSTTIPDKTQARVES